MKIAFFGTAAFAVPALRAVAGDVVLVVSQPDRPSGRGMRMTSSPVKQAALELGLPVETPERARAPEFLERLRGLGLDVLLVAAYGQILSQAVLDSSVRGGINLHGSILPAYRGAAPIQRCLLAGETETGVTLMQMERGMDTGDVVAIERTPIGPDETYGELQDRLARLAGEMAAAWLPRIAAGDYPRVPQDHERATYAPKVEKAEAEISFDRGAREEYNRFRAFTPSPGAFLRTRLGLLRLGAVRPAPDGGEPATILASSPSLKVAMAEGSLELLEVQPEGKRRMSGRDFANGARLRPGERLKRQ
jgi:methionyl-tRNA formyltransferase